MSMGGMDIGYSELEIRNSKLGDGKQMFERSRRIKPGIKVWDLDSELQKMIYVIEELMRRSK
jgi:hypothetical protein